MTDTRRFEVKTRLSAEEVVSLGNCADRKGLSTSALLRMWIKEQLERDCTEQAAAMLVAAPNRAGNVSLIGRSFGNR